MFRSTAHLYDLIYEAQGKDYRAEAEEIRDLVQRRRPSATSLLDVGCGTGGHLVYLRNWFEVAGVDVDESMLAIAAARLAGVPLVEADMRNFDAGRRFDAAICLFSAIGYMPTTEALDQAVATMANHLNSRGVLVVDGWVLPEKWIGNGTTHVDVAEDDDTKIVRVSRSERDGKQTRLEMHHLVATLGQIDHLVDHHVLTLFERDEYEDAFRRAGLDVEVLPSPMPGRDRYVGVVTR